MWYPSFSKKFGDCLEDSHFHSTEILIILRKMKIEKGTKTYRKKYIKKEGKK